MRRVLTRQTFFSLVTCSALVVEMCWDSSTLVSNLISSFEFNQIIFQNLATPVVLVHSDVLSVDTWRKQVEMLC